MDSQNLYLPGRDDGYDQPFATYYDFFKSHSKTIFKSESENKIAKEEKEAEGEKDPQIRKKGRAQEQAGH